MTLFKYFWQDNHDIKIRRYLEIIYNQILIRYPNFDSLPRRGGFTAEVGAEVRVNICKNIFRSGVCLS